MKIRLGKMCIIASIVLQGCILAQTREWLTFAKARESELLPESTLYNKSQKELCNNAKLVSVKVLGAQSWGSGILIGKNLGKKGSRYTIVTNGHVLKENQKRYQIETHDGNQHQAFVLARFDHEQSTGNDLALLQFDSYLNYEVATLDKWSAPEKVMAAGFPIQPDPKESDTHGFMCTQTEEVFRILDEPMQNGYQLAYFATISKGMSGGPLLNEKGKLVGINGLGEPFFLINHDIYLYRDGRRVSESLGIQAEEALEKLANASWAIPSETLVYLSPSILNLTVDTQDNSRSYSSITSGEITSSEIKPISLLPTSPTKLNLSYPVVEHIAENITVLVTRSRFISYEKSITFSNSGVIIARNNKKYYVLTTESRERLKDDYEVITPDFKEHKAKVIVKYPDLELVILEFRDGNNYSVAPIVDTNILTNESLVYLSGWRVVESGFNFTMVDGEIVDLKAEGIEPENKLIYTNRTYNGMIGGAVLNERGQLIGLHRGLREGGGIGEGIPIQILKQVIKKNGL